mmetsp:Transcript_2101/g.6681  ORF Transcript_2101/g.6681 Transcript_2101/m.6681 type:complete len:504 (+) Transcript_2101:3-1514(+)
MPQEAASVIWIGRDTGVAGALGEDPPRKGMPEAAEAAAPSPGVCRRVAAYLVSNLKGIIIVPIGKTGPPGCANCAQKAATYCVDCKKSLCRFCAVLLHHPTTKAEKHSLEEIDFHQIPVKILSPILLDLCLIVAGAFLMSGPGITAEYFDGSSYCPALSRGRRWLTWFDANLFFYWKGQMSKYCDFEDSYWRFFMDTWVRGILTDTDTWTLMAGQVFRAFLFEEFLRFLVTPILALMYAVFATVIRLLEWHLALILPEEEKAFINGVGRVFARFSFAQSLAIKEKKPPPPPTLFRKRPKQDLVEGARYVYDRHTRLIAYYNVQAQNACRFIFRGTLKVAILVRFLCMALGHSQIRRWVHLVGLSDVADKHVTWFSESSGMDLQQLKEGARISDTSISDWIVVSMLSKAADSFPLVVKFGQEAGEAMANGAVGAFSPVLRRYGIPLLLLLAPYLLWTRMIKSQQKAFADRWKRSTVQELFGTMNREAPCASWSEVRFSNPEGTR